MGVRLTYDLESAAAALEFCRAAADWDQWYATRESQWLKMPCGHSEIVGVKLKALEGTGEDSFCGLCYVQAAEDMRRFLLSQAQAIGKDGRRLLRTLMDARKGMLTQS